MRYRKLGRTDFLVSEIGYGTWGIGGDWGGRDDKEAVKALNKAIDLGVNFIDTALIYGGGHSENIVGKVVGNRGEKIFVATKIPPKKWNWPDIDSVPIEEAFPYSYVLEKTEESLRNLGLECIDLLQFHAWSDKWCDDMGWIHSIEKLKEDGKIRFFGISINDYQPENSLGLINSGNVDAVQVIYNIFEQAPEVELFPLCMDKNVGVIVRVPLDEGGLTGKITPDYKFPEGDWRNNYFKGERKKELYERVIKLKFLLHDDIKTIAEAALRFCLSNPAVSTVIPGMRKVEHVIANCSVSDGRLLPGEDLMELKKHIWRRNFYIGAWD